MRSAQVQRKTKETDIRLELKLDGIGQAKVVSPLGFFNHMLETFAVHSGFDLNATMCGDIEVDQHHLVEDAGLVLGLALAEALDRRQGIMRAGFFAFPMDEAMAWAAVDLSGRPYCHWQWPGKGRKVAGFHTENLSEFFSAFCRGAGACLHLEVRYGRSEHHKVEALFKAFARALAEACRVDRRRRERVPSAKEVL
jgi:imidazoleglycerol-phosphate dehydratase